MWSSPSAWRRISRLSLLALALTVALLGHPAQAAFAHALTAAIPASNYCHTSSPCLPPNCGSGDQSSNCGEALAPHNGNVQHHPVIYLVFWGGAWNDPRNPNYQEFAAIISEVEGLFNSLAGTAYNNILTQYTDSQDFVYNDVKLGGIWTDDVNPIPVTIGKTQFDNEVISTQAHKGWHGTADTQFILFPQQGAHLDPIYDKACGQHDYANDTGYQTPYSFVRYASDWGGCNFFGDNAASMTTIAAHEYAEAATDPTGPGVFTGLQSWGWASTNPITDPIEVGDQCQGYNGSDWTSDSYVSGKAPWLWDQRVSGCVPMRGQDYPSPDHTASFHGAHTVQGAILVEYQALGATGSALGQPMTEETPLAGGRVSYFAGQVCSGGSVIPSNTGYGGSGLTSGSAIFWTSGTGAHEVQGCIYQEYMVVMGGPGGKLGFPILDEQGFAGIAGRVSYLTGQVCNGGYDVNGIASGSGVFYTGPTGAHEVQGCIYQAYWNAGGPYTLGFPILDEQSIAGGKASYFTGQVCDGGDVINNMTTGSGVFYNGAVSSFGYEVQGCIYHEYMNNMGGPSILGFPTSDELGIAGGRVSYFAGQVCTAKGPNNSGSAIYYTGSTREHEVQGCIYYKYWHDLNGPSGCLGFPTSDEFTNDSAGDRQSNFQHGSIIWHKATGALTYTCL